MDYTYLHHQIGLTLLNNVGPIKARHLIQLLGGIEPLFMLTIKELHQITDYKKSFFRSMNRTQALISAENSLNFLLQHNIQPHFYMNVQYPRRLHNCGDAPLLLYQKGELDLNENNWVSVVGTRLATPYGRAIVKELISSFQGRNITVVSGLALGIDACVHEYCIKYDVPTVAVLGHGLDRIYPHQNRSLAANISRSGALLTEFMPGTVPDRENFPKRNRIVAGMCDATIVIESKKKGGSLITAELANGYHKDVFAYPGSVFAKTSSGCNALISTDQAHLIQSPKDFLAYMNWDSSERKNVDIQSQLFVNLTVDQKKIVGAISSTPIQIDVLSSKLGIPISTLNASLTILEMEGVIQQFPGKRYTVC